MSLRLRLIALVCGALVLSLVLGGATAWLNASRSVRNEMRSALLVGRQTIENAIERVQQDPDPSRAFDELVGSFEGNRHLRVRLIGEAQALAAPVVERPLFGAVPSWFVRVIGVVPVTDRVSITVNGRDYGWIALETDPHNEVLEVWNEFTDGLVTPAVLSGLTILLIYLFIGRALQPLEALAKALEQVGGGRYRTRMGGRLAPELARLRDSFNRMAARLAAADAENRRLNELLLTLQEQERSEIARDLHDEVSPFLFAINIDAASASRMLREGRAAKAGEHVQSIADAVRPLQQQVRSMLSRLRPIGLDEFGLREAVENMIAFWQRRCPEIHYHLRVSAGCEDLGEPMSSTICRIVQESLSNGVRHAEATLITVSIDRRGEEVRVEILDNGRGMSKSNRPGFGLIGIGERVRAIGGRLTVSSKPGGGVEVAAVTPLPPAARGRWGLGAGGGAMKILIVDDHPIVRAGLRRLLTEEPQIEIHEAGSGREALSVFREQQPTLVILDLNLPGIGGLGVLARLKAVDPDVRVLVLSMHDDEIHITRALRAGAAGYVTKNAPPQELLEAIGRVAAGQTYIEHEIAEELVFASIRASPHPLEDLSSRDLEILRQLAEGHTLSQIADTVGIGYKTAANNCSRIKARLGVATTAELIRIAIRAGLVTQDVGVSAVPIDERPI